MALGELWKVAAHNAIGRLEMTRIGNGRVREAEDRSGRSPETQPEKTKQGYPVRIGHRETR
jgi:hypothetical protein